MRVDVHAGSFSVSRSPNIRRLQPFRGRREENVGLASATRKGATLPGSQLPRRASSQFSASTEDGKNLMVRSPSPDK